MKTEIYRNYFDIDPDYFPAVNADVIRDNPDLWKKYYPHETFVRLIKDTVCVLTRKQKLNIWVEGAYGTGKSHSVLTLKHLIDANEADTKAYFEEYKLDNDLLNKFQGVKNTGKILTIHRYGSSSIHGDNDLFLSIQESIVNALEESGIENHASYALKASVINYLEDTENKKIFDILVSGPYKELFGGESVDTIIQNLKTYTDQSLLALMAKISKVASERQITAFKLTDTQLCNWIKEVISANNLKGIFFIWDEFDEYFTNNARHLTGFQTIAELSETTPFYLMLVTHQSESLFDDADSDKTKILGRFLKPTCQIELPENMAFMLMGAAMRKKDDPVYLEQWQDITDELADRTRNARKAVMEKAKINDAELTGIVPIHPYAALLLKHISVTFDSNQRSMFDFIKNGRGDEILGFQWFIDNNSPFDDNPLLTIDQLWGFFYDRGKEHLTQSVRSILDNYTRLSSRNLDSIEKRVLKTILLFQAMSLNVGDAVDLFIPNEKNIELAFEGTDIDNGAARACAEKLVRDKIIFKKDFGNGKFQYSILTNELDTDKIEKIKAQYKDKQTSSLISDGDLLSSIQLPPSVKIRYSIDPTGSADFETNSKRIAAEIENKPERIFGIVAFAKNNSESVAIGKKIKSLFEKDPNNDVVIIDTTSLPLGESEFESWVKNKATAAYLVGKDNDESRTYEGYASDVLTKWRTAISGGEITVYSKENTSGEVARGCEALFDILKSINRRRFPLCIEDYPAIDNMFLPNSLKLGIECGITQTLKGTFNSTVKKLDIALDGAWKIDKYWETRPNLQISKIKIAIDSTIQKAFEDKGRISIREIYNVLREAPYGFRPCNLSAFILGFILKEYASGTYTWSDDLTSDVLSNEKIKDMAEEVIKLDITASPRYRDKYIVTLTEEEKVFNDTTSTAFGISRSYCTSIEQTRERIRIAMKGFSFPIWVLKYNLGKESLTTPCDAISELIDCYCGIANHQNLGAPKSETDYALSIGKLCIEHPSAAEDLHKILNKEKCTEGMLSYLHEYQGDLLPSLAKKVDDGGQFINILRERFDADAANWVWNIETANKKIEEVALDYKIILESTKCIGKTSSLSNTLYEWKDKCSRIHIPFELIKATIGEARPLFELLCGITRSGSISDAYKKDFLDFLTKYGNTFNEFYNSQISSFKKSCEFYLQDLSDEEISDVYKQFPSGCFIKEKQEYLNIVNERVEEFKKNLGHTKLRNLWLEKTHSKSPYEWSNKYRMPILAMVSDKEIIKAREAFNTINKAHPDAVSISNALEYIEKVSYFDALNDKEARDKAFLSSIVKSFSVIISDVEIIKDYLCKVMTEDPYYWYALPETENKLKQMAEAKYAEGGCDLALERIENMDIGDVKKYLKELIKENMTVGIEIIKSH